MFFCRTASLFRIAYAILDRLRYSGSLTLFWTAYAILDRFAILDRLRCSGPLTLLRFLTKILHSSFFTLHSSLFTLHSSLFTLHFIVNLCEISCESPP